MNPWVDIEGSVDTSESVSGTAVLSLGSGAYDFELSGEHAETSTEMVFEFRTSGYQEHEVRMVRSDQSRTEDRSDAHDGASTPNRDTVIAAHAHREPPPPPDPLSECGHLGKERRTVLGSRHRGRVKAADRQLIEAFDVLRERERGLPGYRLSLRPPQC